MIGCVLCSSDGLMSHMHFTRYLKISNHLLNIITQSKLHQKECHCCLAIGFVLRMLSLCRFDIVSLLPENSWSEPRVNDRDDIYTAKAVIGQIYHSYLLAIKAIGNAFFPSWSIFVLACFIVIRSLFQSIRLNLGVHAFETRAIIFH